MKNSFEKYKLNHSVLDTDHLLLCSKMDNIIDLTSSQHYVDNYVKMDIELLVIEWLCHNMTEEALMRESKFPVIEEHFAMHTQIKSVIANLSNEINKQDSDLMTTLPALLKSAKKVLENHILTEDRKFVAWLTAQKSE
jgi:hemerythrin-like metal-binding protein